MQFVMEKDNLLTHIRMSTSYFTHLSQQIFQYGCLPALRSIQSDCRNERNTRSQRVRYFTMHLQQLGSVWTEKLCAVSYAGSSSAEEVFRAIYLSTHFWIGSHSTWCSFVHWNRKKDLKNKLFVELIRSPSGRVPFALPLSAVNYSWSCTQRRQLKSLAHRLLQCNRHGRC